MRLIAIILFIVGGVLAWRKSDDWMALLVAFTLVLVGAGVGVGDTFAGDQAAYGLPATLLNTLGGLTFFLVFLLFPSGRFVPHWAWCLFLTFLITSIPHQFFSDWPFSLAGWSLLLGKLGFVAALVSIPLSQIYRYWRVSTRLQRQQTKWIIFSITLLIIVLLGPGIVPALSGSLYAIAYSAYIIPAAFALIPLSFTIAILRYRLWDIDVIINRTLVYGALTAGIVALYIFAVGYLSALFRTGNNLLISLVTTGLVAVLFQPGREWLQRGVNRLMYGLRDEPYRVISRLGQRLEAALAPDAVLPAIAETVAQALKLPYAAILLRHQDEASTTVATYGTPGGHLIKLPLVYHTEPIGEFVLAPRSPGEEFSPADRALLGDLARQAGIAAHAVRLTADLQQLADELQASRLRLITTLEEERRRLRRDLHDGLGSALTSVTFQLDAASNLLDRDPQAVKTLLRELKDQMQGSIADIRRLVYNLRPPILDEWGLVPAVREQVAQYQLNQVQVIVAAPEALPPLSAALEVAAYRIALEALSNVIRHAQATTCTIRFDLDNEALIIEVLDDGKGLPGDLHAGVGINAMRERAAELGGTFRIERHAGWGGTQVVASLPLAKE